jgi:chromate transporter
MREWLDLFWAFFCIGGLTFGGGYAMLPMLEREISERRGWATREQVLDYYAVGQCLPGVIAVNVATLIGARRKGARGAAVAACGVVAPSLLVILLIAGFLESVWHLPVVSHAFGGIRAAVCALILSSTLRLLKTGVVDLLTACLFLIALVAVAGFSLTPVAVVAAAGAVGVLARRAASFREGR